MGRNRQGGSRASDDPELDAQGDAVFVYGAIREGAGTNPEELIAAAHAGCFAMALSFQLNGAGFTATTLDVKATLTMEQQGAGWAITAVHLDLAAVVPGIGQEQFDELALGAKANCPVSKVLNATITLDKTLSAA